MLARANALVAFTWTAFFPFACCLVLCVCCRAAASAALLAQMEGVDRFELEYDASQPPVSPVDLLRQGGVLVSCTEGGPLADDYAAHGSEWLRRVHVATYPMGTGLCPKGMSFRSYLSLLVRRYPRQQHCNPYFILHAFDIMQRHESNQEAFNQLRMTPGDLAEVATLSKEQVERVVQLVQRSAKPRPQIYAEVQQMLPAQQKLYRAYQKASARVQGSPQSFASLRSKAFSMWYLFGMWSMSVNINPATVTAHIAFEISGCQYTIDADGRPGLGWPCRRERWRRLVQDPDAAAQFYRIAMQAIMQATQ
jgi:Helitron helicase-like domain at N-terminus